MLTTTAEDNCLRTQGKVIKLEMSVRTVWGRASKENEISTENLSFRRNKPRDRAEERTTQGNGIN